MHAFMHLCIYLHKGYHIKVSLRVFVNMWVKIILSLQRFLEMIKSRLKRNNINFNLHHALVLLLKVPNIFWPYPLCYLNAGNLVHGNFNKPQQTYNASSFNRCKVSYCHKAYIWKKDVKRESCLISVIRACEGANMVTWIMHVYCVQIS